MLSDLRKEIINYVHSYNNLLEENKEKLDIFEGQLKDKIELIMRESLDPIYYNSIKHRIVPVNILPRVINKLSRSYIYGVKRTAIDKNDQELVDYYVKKYSLDQRMIVADNYASLFKAYSLEPLQDRLRVYPLDRFLVYSATNSDEEFDVFIKLVGKKFVKEKNKKLNIYYTYTDFEFDAFDEEGDTYYPAMIGNEGINPYGKIPFVYAERSNTKLIPTQNDDLVQITKSIAITLSDLAGALMYQCFTVLYGIDLNLENLKLSPNAIWQLSSDPKSDKTPSVGQIKPEVDVDKVISFVMTNFSLWLETMGIKSGSLGKLDASSQGASGIAKAIDEMDASDYVKKSQESFVDEEKKLWSLLKTLHNTWVEVGMVQGLSMFSEDFDITIEFNSPEVNKTFREKLEEAKMLYENGFASKVTVMKNLFPKMSEEEIIKEIELINNSKTIFMEDDNGQDREEIQDQ